MTETGKLTQVLSDRQGLQDRMGGEGEIREATKRKEREEEGMATTAKKKRDQGLVFEVRMKKEKEERMRTAIKIKKEEKLLDKLESMPELKEEEDDLVEVFNEESGATSKVTTTLRDHYSHWKETGASQFSLSVIKDGYKIKLEKCPEDVKYEEDNNSSYRKHKEFANEAVAKMEKIKVVKRVKKEECRFINPLTVAVNKVGKKRLCIDLSRGLNIYSKTSKFKIRSHKEVAEVVEKGDYGFGFDLRSFYHQVPIHEDSQDLLCFKIENEGRQEYYKFRMLPFGFNDACRCVTKLMKTPLARWRRWGARTAEIHIDDGIVFAADKKKATDLSRRVRKDLQEYGLLISEDKCSWGARRRIRWIGFEWDTANFKMFVPEDKLERTRKKIEDLLGKKTRKIPIKEVASFCSLMTSMRPALGDIARFRTRALLQIVDEAQKKWGWGAEAKLDSAAVGELEFWMNSLGEYNGFPIRPKPGVVDVRQVRMVSDAGEHMAGGVEWTKDGKKEGSEFQVHLTEKQQQSSSTEREMLGQRAGLRLNAKRLEGRSVRWICDNWATTVIHRVGSMRPRLQQLALEMAELCRIHGISIEWVWKSRKSEEVKVADYLSKDYDFSDFYLSSVDFQSLWEEFGPFSCDYFASSFTFRMHPFMSRYQCEGSAGVDAFTAVWRGNGFFHPPVCKIVETVRYAKVQGAKGVLVQNLNIILETFKELGFGVKQQFNRVNWANFVFYGNLITLLGQNNILS